MKAELIPRHTNKDLTTIRIKVVGDDGVERELIVASSYLPCRDAVPSDSLKALVEDGNLGGSGLIIGCDSNSHHALWGSRTTDNRGHDLLEFLVNSGLDVVNRGTEPTFSNSRGETLIDITVCTPNLNDLIQNWRVSYEDSLSDHK